MTRTIDLACVVSLASLACIALVGCGEQPAATPAAAAPAATTSSTVAAAGQSAGPSSANRVVAGPIVAEPGVVDFGLVAPRALVEAEITLTNTSDRPVKILVSKPTCQCTTVDMAGKVIPPKGSIQMPMSMQTSAAVGIKAAAVSLLFEGVQAPLRVDLKAEVAYSVVGRPVPYIDALEASRLSGTFDLESPNGQPFRVLAVQGAPPVFVGFDPAVDAPRPRYTLRYDFRALPQNAVPKYLLVETDREDCPLVDLRVRHESTRIAPAFKFAEYRSMLGRVMPGDSAAFTLEVEEMGPARFDAVYALSPDATVSLVDQKSDGKNLLVTVSVTPRPGFTGLLQLPVTFAMGPRTSEHLVYGLVKERSASREGL